MTSRAFRQVARLARRDKRAQGYPWFPITGRVRGFPARNRLPCGPTGDPELIRTQRSVAHDHEWKGQVHFTADLPKAHSSKVVRRLLGGIAKGRLVGHTTTLADPGVIASMKEEYV